MRICALQALKRIDELEEMPDNDYLYMVEQFQRPLECSHHPQGTEVRCASIWHTGKSRRWKKEEEPRPEHSVRN